jgi:hypothetical protein
MKKTWEIIIYDGNDSQLEVGLGPWKKHGGLVETGIVSTRSKC